ncbi:HpcH/HpaI aldolase [Dinoroseobacter shibae DFL 12 = DSM 16493]|jgi:citrate lyase subunit beta/citryl-CoA lyase/(S)-citramalyl-CoA lyase|uniref:HpcH/HpaI aldolase n=1 Tax=Dinoroseobacter shibae (strain DSM 16493 / NCIMB 14021 / DFL 12) TaxID=398580 RepID=A8LSH3_DINSH|nr:CoA ester lyase [Dinoroseobacter shibae]ABV92787.1 HpcH/HpaI aldolase [Dinoroseobacter shibae DFL 12 = DSM 16493]URF47729.1 CoA ester lyase [Dinoroseobacter shibae]URF52039.1 CoA ester lyase [Dinoroseobacter shibae]
MTAPRALRSFLFAPANRPAIFDKARGSGADAVCLDLEDAVPPDQKATARAPALEWLVQAADPGCGVRINGLRTPEGLADIAALCAARPGPGFVLLPKVGAAAEVQIAAEALEAAGSDLSLGALIETAEGLEAVARIARASDRLSFLLFGAVDLAADLGVDGSDAALAYARGRVVHAGRAAGRPVLDVPALDFRDLAAVGQAAARAKAHGFSGKAAIHPSNIAVINDAFTPGAEEIAEAQEVLALYEASPNGLAVRNGKLIEKPVIRAMEARLALARAAGRL